MSETITRLSDRVRLLPVIHGSGDSMLQTRRRLLAGPLDVLAVPLPPSHRTAVLAGIERLPEPSVAVQVEPPVPPDWPDQWSVDSVVGMPEEHLARWQERLDGRLPPSVVAYASAGRRPKRINITPIDPCQPVIAAIRLAVGEHRPVEFIDAEMRHIRPLASVLPDPYALKAVPLETFSAAMLPFLPPPRTVQHRVRLWEMAARLAELEQTRRRDQIVMVCSVADWPWIRQAYRAVRRLGDSDNRSDSPTDRSTGDHDYKDHRKHAEDIGENPAAPSSRDATSRPRPSSIGRPPGRAERIAAGLLPAGRIADAVLCPVAPETHLFLLGELPYTTALYERARQTADHDDDLTIDAIKSLFLDARQLLPPARRKRITAQRLSAALTYARNLTLLDRRLTPDFYTLVVAAQQTLGDRFAEEVARLAGNYAFRLPGPEEGLIDLLHEQPKDVADTGVPGTETLAVYDAIREHQAALTPRDRPAGPTVFFGPGVAGITPDEPVPMTNRLAGPPMVWRRLKLTRRPDDASAQRFQYGFNPHVTCSYPPEDEAVEAFRAHVFHRAKTALGMDAASTQKFTTSLLDGIDIRETLRHWYEGGVYVKNLPPVRGTMDAAVMLFDVPADPQQYGWRTTWYAENENESTLAFFATDFRSQPVGPGICRATYGGALFLFPPRAIPDIWADARFDFCDTLEERLIAAACRYARSRHIALLSPAPPGRGWALMASLHGKRLVHLPLSQFSGETIERLRDVHVLGGHQVRSYASRFIEGRGS